MKPQTGNCLDPSENFYVLPLLGEISGNVCWIVAIDTIEHSVGVFGELEDALTYVQKALVSRKKERSLVRVHCMFGDGL